MTDGQVDEQRAMEVAAAVGALAQRHTIWVSVAESLTGGKVANQLSAVAGAREWFVGGLVAYQSWVKHQVLGVPEGPVISEQAVVTMADEVASLLQADAAVAVSGAGGPAGQEGHAPGTAWIAVRVHGTVRTRLHHFTGAPIDILGQTEFHALDLLRATISAVLDHPSAR